LKGIFIEYYGMDNSKRTCVLIYEKILMSDESNAGKFVI